MSHIRTIRASEIRSKNGNTVYGYAAVFNKDSEDLGGFIERIKPGAFDDIVEKSDVRLLWNHDANHVLARTASGTLKLSVDKKGLYFEAILPNTTTAKDLKESLTRQDVNQCSFAFSIAKDSWERRGDIQIRYIEKIEKLFDISLVTYPAYPDTSVALRGQIKGNNYMPNSQNKLGALWSEVEEVKVGAESEGRALNHIETRLIDKVIAELESMTGLKSAGDVTTRMAAMDAYLRQSVSAPVRPYTGDTHREAKASGPFRSFGEQMLAVYRAGLPGNQTDNRLFEVRAASGLNETVPSDGGFLVQQEFSNRLLERGMSEAVLAPRCDKFELGPNVNSIKLPMVNETSRATGSRYGGVRVYWADEADAATKSKPNFRSLELNLKKMIGLCYATDELLQDATVLENFLTRAFGSEMAFVLDDCIIRGDGAGKPLGYLNGPCLVTQDKETGQAADTVVFENLVKMWARMPARNRRNAVWILNQEVETQLFTMSLAVGTGGVPVYLPAGGASSQPYGSLFGRPIIPMEQASALGDVGDVSLIDPTQYILAEKGGMQADMSIHVRFVYDESVFRFVFRCDGQPGWNNSLTPYKGANSLSPFVTLQAR